MVLDKIIELELEFLKRNRVPTRVFMSLANYATLVKELEVDRYYNVIHNMQIEITKSGSTQLIVI